MMWTFGGVSLDKFGAFTLLDDYLGSPERRGENLLVPFRHGRVHVAKYYDQRTMVIGFTKDCADAAELEALMDELKQLIGVPGQQALVGYFRDGTVRQGQAEVVDAMLPKRFAPGVSKFTLDFVLPDPFLRSTSETSEVITVDATPKAGSITNPGTVGARNPTIILTGPLENTEIVNSTTGVSVKYNAAIAAPRVVTIQEVDGEIIATDDLAANVIGNVTHSGSAALMVIDPGANTLSITDDVHTTGEVEIAFYAPYL